MGMLVEKITVEINHIGMDINEFREQTLYDMVSSM